MASVKQSSNDLWSQGNFSDIKLLLRNLNRVQEIPKSTRTPGDNNRYTRYSKLEFKSLLILAPSSNVQIPTSSKNKKIKEQVKFIQMFEFDPKNLMLF